MFTIKLFANEDQYNVLECPNYNISRFYVDVPPENIGDKSDQKKEVVEITLYKDFTTQEGVTYRIADYLEIPHWKYAFIENSSGKTIDHIRPK